MKDFWNGKRITLACIFILGLLFILFAGREFNSQTSKREWIFTTKGITHFRKGLDISGGTKLVYKIDYNKYKELYSNEEFSSIKKTIEGVILKNIDSRISSLGVSDYKAYIQELDKETQVIVEIGGIADLNQAKEIIGKTVELEFRIENKKESNEETKEIRRRLAEKIRDEVMAAPEKMTQLYENQKTENIYSNSHTSNIEGLPDFYKKNQELLENASIGIISEIHEGMHESQYVQNDSGDIQIHNINGYTMFRVNKKETKEKTILTKNDIVSFAEKENLSYSNHYTTENLGIATGEIKIEEKKIIYNEGLVVPKEEKAYNVRIIEFTRPNTIGKENEEADEIMNNFNLLLEGNKAMLTENPKAIIEGGKEILDNYIEEKQILRLIPGFEADNYSGIKTFEELDKTYILLIKDVKESGEEIVNFTIIDNIADIENFTKKLKTETIYDIDEIFIKDSLDRKVAQGNDGSILNGAYFTIAEPSTTELGQPSVSISFNEKGSKIFCEITSNNIGESMGIFIGGVPATIATIQTKICDGRAQISGGFDREKAIATAKELNSGNMPTPLILIQEGKVNPSLGDSAFQGALLATLVGVIAIILYIFFIYGWKKTIVTTRTIIFFFICLLTLLKLIDYALSLSGIAAIILSIGMAIDANILIFERMNEEIKNGETTKYAISNAIKRSRPAIRDGQISTLLIGLLLFAYGINMFKGFGAMIILTVLLTIFLNIPFINEMLKIIYKDKK